MRVHELKTIRQFFKVLYDETKTFEIRKNDRDFRDGDILVLRETAKALSSVEDYYTGRVLYAEIVAMWGDVPGLEKGYVAIAIKLLETSCNPSIKDARVK